VVYTSSLQTAAGCDSSITTTVNVNPTYALTESASVCSGNSYTFPDGSTQSNITAQVVYTSSLQTAAGCDSSITTTVNVNPTYALTASASICSGDNYIFPDGSTQTNITAQVVYTSSFQTTAGCDSSITTTVNVNPTYDLAESASVCSGDSYTFPDGGTQSNITAQVVYTSSLQTAAGCDSSITTTVNVVPVYNIAETVSVCSGDSYTFPDGSVQSNITTQVVYTSYIQTATACDSSITTTVDVNPLPSVWISENSLPEFCQGAVVLLTANGDPGLQYFWSTSETTNAIEVGANGAYTVFVTTPSGCISQASHVVAGLNASELLSSYTILAEKGVKLKDHNTVATGAVGVMRKKKKVELEDNSHITDFVKADKLELSGGSSVGSYIDDLASVQLPVFLENPYGGSNLTVNQGATVILTDSIYGHLHIENDATVTFTQPRVYINHFKTGKNCVVHFNGCSDLIVRKKVEFKENTIFNPEGESVTIYVDDKVEVEEQCNITANLYVDQKLEVKATSNEPTYMTGMFLAYEVKGENNVVWNRNQGPCVQCNSTPLLANGGDAYENGNADHHEADHDNDVAFSVNMYPNPSSDLFSVTVDAETDNDVLLRVFDCNSILREQHQYNTGTDGNVRIFGAGLQNGVYFVHIISGQHSIVLRAVKVQ
ncbi:T9SS type A sorting domain-containing protein, partial [Bacteroidota bacterium]